MRRQVIRASTVTHDDTIAGMHGQSAEHRTLLALPHLLGMSISLTAGGRFCERAPALAATL